MAAKQRNKNKKTTKNTPDVFPDWRTNSTSVTVEDIISPKGILHKAGMHVTLTSMIEYRKNRYFSILIPNATASYLNISKNSWNIAHEIRKESGIDTSHRKFTTENPARLKNIETMYDYLEAIMQSIVFAFSALEAFANEWIPDDYIYIKQKDGNSVKYGKEKIERYLTITEKYSSVLPRALEVRTPKGNNRCWENLRKLKKIRDRLIHMKSSDRKSSGPDSESIWHKLVKCDPPYQQAFSVIEYFVENVNKDEHNIRWYETGKTHLKK